MEPTFQIVSDVHSEFGFDENEFPPKLAPVLLMAGDIGNVYSKYFKRIMSYVSCTWTRVYYVPGNHEYYAGKQKNMNIMFLKYIEELAMFHNIFFVYPGEVFYDSGYHIIGCTLWSTPSDISDNLNDFHKIRINKDLITPGKMAQLHIRELSYMEDYIKAHPKQKIIVLTHFPPIYNTSHPKYAKQGNSSYFMNDVFLTIPDLNKHKNIHAWIYGHTHYSNVQNLHGIKFMSSQMGYPGEPDDDTGFSDSLATFS